MFKEAVTTLLTLAWLIAGIWMLFRACSGNRKQGPCVVIAAGGLPFLIAYVLFWPIAVLIDAISIRLGFVLDEPERPAAQPLIKLEDPVEPLADAGACGVAVTNLKPSGFVAIESRRLPAISDGGFIEAGTRIVLRGQKGRLLIVVPDEESSV